MTARTGRPEDGGTSLEKGLVLLQELATADRPLTIGELAQVAGLNRTTTYRLCDVLERGGWLRFAGDGSAGRRRQIDLGPRALGLAALATSKYDAVRRLQPLIDNLSKSVGETVHAGVLDGTSVIHVARAVPEAGPHMAVSLGAREFAHVTALGKALLAALPREDVLQRYRQEALPVRSQRSLASRSALLAELELVARRGYSVDDEESRPGVRCVGAPIFGGGRTPVFAVSVTSMPVNLEGERLEAVAASVMAATEIATAAFGGTAPAWWRAGGVQ